MKIKELMIYQVSQVLISSSTSASSSFSLSTVICYSIPDEPPTYVRFSLYLPPLENCPFKLHLSVLLKIYAP